MLGNYIFSLFFGSSNFNRGTKILPIGDNIFPTNGIPICSININQEKRAQMKVIALSLLLISGAKWDEKHKEYLKGDN